MSENYIFKNNLLKRYLFLLYYAQKSGACIAKPLKEDETIDQFYLTCSDDKDEDIYYPEWQIYQNVEENLRVCTLKRHGKYQNRYLVTINSDERVKLISPTLGSVLCLGESYAITLDDKDLVGNQEISFFVVHEESGKFLSSMVIDPLDVLRAIGEDYPKEFLKEESLILKTIRNCFVIKNLLQPYFHLVDLEEEWCRSNIFQDYLLKFEQCDIAKIRISIRYPCFNEVDDVKKLLGKIVYPEVIDYENAITNCQANNKLETLISLLDSEIDELAEQVNSFNKTKVPRFQPKDFLGLNVMEMANLFSQYKDILSEDSLAYCGQYNKIFDAFYDLIQDSS